MSDDELLFHSQHAPHGTADVVCAALLDDLLVTAGSDRRVCVRALGKRADEPEMASEVSTTRASERWLRGFSHAHTHARTCSSLSMRSRRAWP